MSYLLLSLEVSFLFHDIEWPTYHLFMDIGDIDTYQAQWHQHDSYHDSIDHYDDPDIGESVVCDPELVDKLEKKCDAPRRYNEESDISDEFEWEKWKWSERVESESEQHLIVVASLSVETGFCIEYERLLRESEPIDETAIHAILLRKTQICIDNCSIQETIVGCTRF